jgi:hypothetical protein
MDIIHMNIPKRLYPHLYEYESLLAEGRELGAQMYASKNEKGLIWECKMIFNTKRHREKNCGTNEEIHYGTER